MSQTPVPIKAGDVFRFSWNDKYRPSMDAYWCFDGQLVAKETARGMLLVDTYWCGSENRTYTPAEAEQKGTLEFVCNMDDVVEIKHYEAIYYDEADVINLSYQHGCYKRYVIRKGTLRSKAAMLKHAYSKINEAREAIKSRTFDIERMAAKVSEIENGKDLTQVWL